MTERDIEEIGLSRRDADPDLIFAREAEPEAEADAEAEPRKYRKKNRKGKKHW
jgi:hypothetical protein